MHIAELRSAEIAWRHHPVKAAIDNVQGYLLLGQPRNALFEIDRLETLSATGSRINPRKYAPFLRLLTHESMRDLDDFYADANQLLKVSVEDPKILNDVAWKIVDPHSKIPRREWPLAVKLGERAVQIDPAKAGYYDTLAWAYYGNRQINKAVRAEKKALSLCIDDDEEPNCKAALALFSGSPR
jgi:tetratricopeptide (TPR) repeat protein